MSSVKPKRRKIPYIGKPATASELAAAYPPLPRKHQEYFDREMPIFLEKIRQREERNKRRSSAKTAREK
jgi:hypothetical protein